MQTFETSTLPTVVVRTGSGHVSIAARDVTATTVELTALNAAADEGIAAARVTHASGAVVVDVPRGGGGLFRPGPKVGVAITCPTGSTLQVKADSADLRTSGILE